MALVCLTYFCVFFVVVLFSNSFAGGQKCHHACAAHQILSFTLFIILYNPGAFLTPSHFERQALGLKVLVAIDKTKLTLAAN